MADRITKQDGLSRVAFVTGAGSGIGRASAQAFAASGARVAAADIDVAAAQETVDLIRDAGGEAISIGCDVTDEQSIMAAIARVMDTFGRLDCAHNNAGISPDTGLIVDCPRPVWDQIMAVNLTGMWMCMKHEIRAMLRSGGGAICNMGSASSLKGLPEISAYVASKHGVIGLTKVAALEFADQGIRVNVVCPGTTDTPGIRAKSETGGLFGLEEFMKGVPIKRIAAPEELARAVVWLCSENASYVTGAVLSVDGGLVLA